jgi:hypothetical protein
MVEQLTFPDIDRSANADLVDRDLAVIDRIKDQLCKEREEEVASTPRGIVARIFKRYERETHFQRTRRIEIKLICLGSILAAADELLQGQIDYPDYVISREVNLAMGGIEAFYTKCKREELLKDSGYDGN